MTDVEQFPSEILNNKNKNDLRCQYCNSLLLKSQEGEYLEKSEITFPLPLMHQKHSRDVHSLETEPISNFWLVSDMFTFENIGFSHTVDNYKFLTCADCEMGPVGYHDITSKKCFIALKRVRHGDSKEKASGSD